MNSMWGVRLLGTLVAVLFFICTAHAVRMRGESRVAPSFSSSADDMTVAQFLSGPSSPSFIEMSKSSNGRAANARTGVSHVRLMAALDAYDTPPPPPTANMDKWGMPSDGQPLADNPFASLLDGAGSDISTAVGVSTTTQPWEYRQISGILNPAGRKLEPLIYSPLLKIRAKAGAAIDHNKLVLKYFVQNQVEGAQAKMAEQMARAQQQTANSMWLPIPLVTNAQLAGGNAVPAGTPQYGSPRANYGPPEAQPGAKYQPRFSSVRSKISLPGDIDESKGGVTSFQLPTPTSSPQSMAPPTATTINGQMTSQGFAPMGSVGLRGMMGGPEFNTFRPDPRKQMIAQQALARAGLPIPSTPINPMAPNAFEGVVIGGAGGAFNSMMGLVGNGPSIGQQIGMGRTSGMNPGGDYDNNVPWLKFYAPTPPPLLAVKPPRPPYQPRAAAAAAQDQAAFIERSSYVPQKLHHAKIQPIVTELEPLNLLEESVEIDSNVNDNEEEFIDLSLDESLDPSSF